MRKGFIQTFRTRVCLCLCVFVCVGVGVGVCDGSRSHIFAAPYAPLMHCRHVSACAAVRRLLCFALAWARFIGVGAAGAI